MAFGSTTLEIVAGVVVLVLGFVYLMGMGAALQTDRLIQIIKKKRMICVVALFCQAVLNPIFMFGLIQLFGSSFSPQTKLSAILISCAPGGNGSNLLSVLSGGDLEASIAMTFFSTMAAFISTPLMVTFCVEVLWGTDRDAVKVPFKNIAGTVATLLLPLLVGIWIRSKKSKETSDLVIKWGIRCGVGALFAVAVSTLANKDYIEGMLNVEPLAWPVGILMNLFGLALGFAASYLARFPVELHRTIAFEVGCQNSLIPLAIVQFSFSSDQVPDYLGFFAVYFLTSPPVNVGLMLFLRKLFPIHKNKAQIIVGMQESTRSTSTITPADQSKPAL